MIEEMRVYKHARAGSCTHLAAMSASSPLPVPMSMVSLRGRGEIGEIHTCIRFGGTGAGECAVRQATDKQRNARLRGVAAIGDYW